MIAAGLISPPMMKMDQMQRSPPQYNHIKTMNSQNYYQRSQKAKELYKVQSVKPKANKKFIKSIGLKKLKESHHKSP